MTSYYQLVFEIVNKVLLSRNEKRNVTSIVDLFFMKVVSPFHKINLSAIMLKHMDKVVNMKHGKPGLSYGFQLNKVFEFFRVPLGRGTPSLRKHKFSIDTLYQCEIIEKKYDVGTHSVVYDLIIAQERAITEVTKITTVLPQKDIEIVKLKVSLQKAQTEEPGGVDSLKSKSMKLKANNVGLERKVVDLTDKIQKAHDDSVERINFLLKSFLKPFS